MSEESELIELSRVDLVTIDAIGLPGERVFYLQAAQDDLIVTLIIEKEHAAALAIAIEGVLERLGQTGHEPEIASLELIQPLRPLFRVGKLGLGYDQVRDMLVVVAEELTFEGEEGAKVHIWASRPQMAGLAHKATAVVSAGRPICPLCKEPIEPNEEHVCVRDNGRKWLYEVG